MTSGKHEAGGLGSTGRIHQGGGGALLLAGVGHDMADQFKRTGIEDLLGQHGIFTARSLVYRSTEAAFEESRRRLAAETPA